MIRLRRLVCALVIGLLPALSVGAEVASETGCLLLGPVDASMSTSYVMQHRPFVLPDHLTPAFDFDAVTTEQVTEVVARAALTHFLDQRNLPTERQTMIVARMDDPAIEQVIPAPNLRAALLMLSDWDPYQATIDAILDGANESGHPYEAVDFRPLEFGSAVATLQVAYSTGQLRLLLSDRYRNESPQQLIPVLVHESMHDGIDNSYEEEITASLLDSLAYAEVLTIDPDAANAGTELAAYNNVQLFAMMNSIGRRGAGYVGVETSFDGDVYIGTGLESFDADSIRAGIAKDPWYAQLPRGGSQGGPVLTVLLGRFPESAGLVSLERFSEEAISVIDTGIGLILTPRKVRTLAIDLQLSLTIGSASVRSPGDLTPTIDNLDARPFLPSDISLFDLRSMHSPPAQLDKEFSRAALRESLLRADQPPSLVSTTMTQFDAPTVIELIPNPSLRAALLMLDRDDRWAPVVSSILAGVNVTQTPVHIEFRDLPNATPAVWDNLGWGGAPAVWVNSMLMGERPELLATAIVEGILLESVEQSTAQSIIAAALSTVLWADFIVDDRSLISTGTWGTISRNRDLLALLNAQPFDPGNPAATSIGLRLATGPEGDVFPGLLRNASSFVDYVIESPRIGRANPPASSSAPPTLTEFLLHAGIEQATPAQPIRIDNGLLATIDLHFASVIPPDAAVAAALALDLTVSRANN